MNTPKPRTRWAQHELDCLTANWHREAADKPDIGGDWTNYVELSVLKNRQGRTGAIGLFYDGPKTQFSNWGGPAPQRSIQASARASSLKSKGLS